MFWESLFFASEPVWLIPVMGTLAALAGFGLLAAFGLGYDPAWPGPPAGARAVARRRTALSAGTVCVVVASLGALNQAVPIEARLIALAQAATMAAAAVCDWRKWQLPLPFTLGGIALGAAGLALAGSPLLWGLAAVTVLAALAINALATAGTLQGGDVLATIWIGLALPGIGLLAFAMGQAGLAIARLLGRWPRATRAPVGGAWLMAAVALLSLPGLPALVEPTAAPTAPPRIASRLAPASDAAWREAARAAADATAWVVFAESGPERVARAAHAAARIRALAGEPHAPTDVVGALSNLAAALEAYDLGAIRAASARLADLRANAAFHKEP
ncbi:MAG TPA: hypothetical protein PKY66_09425 [Thermoflexales bacterium]|nr:hypothetical protein [Thermoflexales bacterium]